MMNFARASVNLPVVFLLALGSQASWAEALLVKDGVLATTPKDQAYVGFCWSYAVNGLIEGETLKKKGITLDLSEEYVGFHHLYNQILENMPTLRRLAIYKTDRTPLTPFRKTALQVFVLALLHPSEGASGMGDMLNRVAQVGVVPESIFSYKIDTEGKMVEDRLTKFAAERMIYKEDLDFFNSPAGRDQLYTEVAQIFGATPPKPDDVFTFEGKPYTARTFMRDYVEFNPWGYRGVEISKENRSEGLRLVRKTLDGKTAVPIGFVVYDDMKKAPITGRFDPAQCTGGHCSKAVGGHAVLAVNALVDGDSDGALTGLLVKNSWGSAQGLNSLGILEGDTRGFNLITMSYLDQSIADGKNWEAVLPLEIAGSAGTSPRAFPPAEGRKTYQIVFSKPLLIGLVSFRKQDDAMKMIMSAMGRSVSLSRKRGEHYDPSVAAPVIDRIDFDVKDPSGRKWPAMVTLTVENTSREEMVIRFRDYPNTSSAQ